MINNQEYFIQISSGQGPDECCRAVYLLLENMIKKAKKNHKMVEVIETIKSKTNKNCFKSTLLKIDDKDFFEEYLGTIQWICQSPFRKTHKRQNWFIGITLINLEENISLNIKDVKIEKTRSGGPGGQHVNKTESAIKVTHLPTKLTTVASEQRCQHANKKLALWRLELLIEEFNNSQQNKNNQKVWNEHHQLKRGNAAKTFVGEEFKEK